MASDENDSVNMVPTIVVLPFTYDVEGLKVEEYLREAGGRLYDLLVGTTPLSSPAEDESAKFFAAQATHYDLGQGGTEQETKEALISAIKEEEQTELQVPEAIRHLEERMASLFERKRQVLADELALQDEWTQQEASDPGDGGTLWRSGDYDIEATGLDELHDCTHDQYLRIVPLSRRGYLFAKFDFDAVVGIMRSRFPFDPTKDSSVELRWRNERYGPGQKSDMLNEVAIEFLPGGKLHGTMWWDGLFVGGGGTFDFDGVLDPDVSLTHQDTVEMKREWFFGRRRHS